MIILVHTHVFTADKWKLGRVWSFGIFNSYRRKTGQVHPRGEILSPGDYHLVLGIVVYNEAGKIDRLVQMGKYGGFRFSGRRQSRRGLPGAV